MQVDFTKLPIEIQRKIPLSLRSRKSIYDLDELPGPIYNLVKSYTIKGFDVNYKVVFDIKSSLSIYGDFETITNMSDLVCGYLENYFKLTSESYPFDAVIECKMKQYVNTKDVAFRQTLISNELNNIISIISDELGVKISVNDIKLIPTSSDNQFGYNILINISIGQDKNRILNIEFV